jgi:hypothetical protein
MMLLSSASVAVVACENPSLPNLPPEKGRIREREQRLIELDTLRYIREIEEYVACLKIEHAAVASDGEPSLEASLIAGRNNAAVAELDAVSAVYEDRIGPIDVRAWEIAQAERRASAYQQWRRGSAASSDQPGTQNATIGPGDRSTEVQMLGGIRPLPDSVELEKMRRCGTSPAECPQ